jgi:TolB protein
MKLHLKVIILVILITFASFCITATIRCQVPGTEVQLTTNHADQFDPSISGYLVAYSDRRNVDADIYLYNITSGVETQITSGGGDQLLPCISGNLVAYTDFGTGNADICVYNVTSGKTIRVTNNPSNQQRPSISGLRVAYEDDRSGDWNIYVTDLKTMKEIPLTSDPANQVKSSISGSRVVWEDHRTGNADIRMFDFSDNSTTVISNMTAQETDPYIDGDIVAYASDVSSSGDIYYYCISTGETTAITAGVAYECNPSVSGDYISYESYATGNSHVWVYSISKGISHCVLLNHSDQYLHDMSGDHIVYTDNRNSNLDVYMYTITSFPRDAEINYDDGVGETFAMVHQTQYLRQRFLLTDFDYAGLFLVKTIRICWGSTSPDFTALIRLRHYNTTKITTVANVTHAASGWQDYNVHSSEFVDNNFYVEIWQTSGYGYVSGDTTAPQNKSQNSVDGGLNWSLFAPNMNFMIRVVILKPQHDTALTRIGVSKTIVGQGCPLSVNITIENQGDLTEKFNVTLSIGRVLYVLIHKFVNITLSDGSKTTLGYVCLTSSWTYGNSTLGVYASPVLHEKNVSNNGQSVKILVTILGDVNGDKKVNVLDLILTAHHLGHTDGDGHTPSTKEWYDCMNTDLNNDGQHNVLDLIICANHLGQQWS